MLLHTSNTIKTKQQTSENSEMSTYQKILASQSLLQCNQLQWIFRKTPNRLRNMQPKLKTQYVLPKFESVIIGDVRIKCTKRFLKNLNFQQFHLKLRLIFSEGNRMASNVIFNLPAFSPLNYLINEFFVKFPILQFSTNFSKHTFIHFFRHIQVHKSILY